MARAIHFLFAVLLFIPMVGVHLLAYSAAFLWGGALAGWRNGMIFPRELEGGDR